MGGSTGGSLSDLQLTSAQKMDPATEARQLGLWNQAQQLAATQPFSSQYGGASQLGLSRMSTEGQRYLSNQILGPGQYWEGAKDLGFKGYERPDEAAGGAEWVYNPDLRGSRTKWTTGASWTSTPTEEQREFDRFGNVIRYDSTDEIPPGDNVPPSLTAATTQPQYDKFGNVITQWQNVPPFSSTAAATQPAGTTQQTATTQQRMMESSGPGGAGGLLGTRAEEEAGRAAARVGPGDPGWEAFLSAEEARSPGRRLALEADAAAHPYWHWPVPGTARPYSQGVGIREMEEAGDVTRRMLRETEPGTPGYDRFLPGGWTEGGEAGIGETPGFTRDAAGNLVPIPGFGFTGAQLEGDTTGPGGEVIPGYRPGYDAIRGGVTGVGADATRATPFGVAEQDPVTFGALDAEGQPLLDPITGLPAGDVPAVRQGLISAQTGYGVQGTGQRIARDAAGEPLKNPDGSVMMEPVPLAMTEAQRELSQIGQAAGPQGVVDPVTGDVRSAAERITGGDISPIGQFRDAEGLVTDVMTPGAVTDPTLTGPTAPVSYTDLSKTAFDVTAPEGLKDFTAVTGEPTTDVGAVTPTAISGPGGVTVNSLTGEVTQAVGAVGPGAIAGPQGLTVDPVTGQVTQAVGGVAPGEFGGASFFGGPAMADYMNRAGVEASVAQARQDYEIALNREKARQAQVGAFGARGTVEEAGLIEAQERNIAQIRGAGYERAAQMMEADAARRQQAGLQGQQLGVQTGLAGQSLEAQRRESDAARAQQAAMAGQQLGFTGQLQTQQLAQAGDIRGAELGLQAAMQGQQLEAQRRSEDAARAQQVALAGQQLGTQAQMQTQQLAQAGGIRGAELGLQAGLQGQQLQAQRREADAARAQQAALAGQALGVQAGMQTQQLGLQAGIQTAQNQLVAAQANQQAALQTGSETQRMEAQRQVDQAQMQLAAQQQTQQLGFQGGMQAQQLGQQADIRQAELDMEAARANQATALTSGSQTQQIQASRQMRQAELNLQRQQQTQQLGLQAGMQQAGFGQQAAVRQTELDLQRQQATQGLGAEAFMQQRQLGQQAAMASASNALAAAQSDQQAALASGNQAAALEAARRAQGAQAQIDVASQTQRLGAGAAGQQAQQEAMRRQRLSEMGLQAGGMGMDAQAQFRQQQMAAAQQLADVGGMRQGATFGAGAQLAGMGAQQEQARQAQMAWDYQQWLRGQGGGAESLALVQSLMPGGQQFQYERPPSFWGQVGGGLLSAAGVGSDIYRTSKMPTP